MTHETLPSLLMAAGAPASAGSFHSVDVAWTDLTLAAALVFVAIGVAQWRRLGLAKSLFIGAVRAVVQLVAVGYLLVYVFAADRWWMVLLVLAVMLFAATITATGRRSKTSKDRDRGALLGITGAALLLGAGLSLAYVSEIVLRVSPWYEPRYLIPLFGMIAGNAMNGAALTAERLASEIAAHRDAIEVHLALGASPARATAEPVRRALTAALIPTINGLMVVGLVQLPGMMTGQILAGQSPLLAVRYQIVIAFALAGATAIASTIVALWYRKRFFTSAEQLRL